MRRAQSFLEYALLVAVALVGLLLTANSLLKTGALRDGFDNHFSAVKERIGG